MSFIHNWRVERIKRKLSDARWQEHEDRMNMLDNQFDDQSVKRFVQSTKRGARLAKKLRQLTSGTLLLIILASCGCSIERDAEQPKRRWTEDGWQGR